MPAGFGPVRARARDRDRPATPHPAMGAPSKTLQPVVVRHLPFAKLLAEILPCLGIFPQRGVVRVEPLQIDTPPQILNGAIKAILERLSGQLSNLLEGLVCLWPQSYGGCGHVAHSIVYARIV